MERRHVLAESGRRVGYYLHRGGPQAVLLIHGIGQSGLYGKHQLRHFGRRGYTILLPDLAGCGASERYTTEQEYGREKQVEDILRVLDETRINRAHCIGVSMGGLILQTLAGNTEYKQRVEGRITSLVFDSTSTNMYRAYDRNLTHHVQLVGRKATYAAYCYGNDVAQFIRGAPSDHDCFQRDCGEKKGLAWVHHHFMRSPSYEDRRALRRAWNQMMQWDTSEDAAQITAPALVLGGTEDHHTPPACATELQQALKQSPSVVRIIEGGQHGLAAKNPSLVNPIMERFFKDVESGLEEKLRIA